MSYVLNDDFNGGTWIDANGTTHSGSSGVTNSLPSTAIWNIATGVQGADFNGPAELVYYPGTTSYIFQDGSTQGNLCIQVGKSGTGGAPSNMWPSGYCDTSAGPEQETGTPKYAVKPGQSCEIRVKVNPLNGLWTACWFLEGLGEYGTNTYGEIDMEEAGDGGSSSPNPSQSQVTIWGGAGGGQLAFGTSGNTNVGDSNWHIFRLDLLNGGNTIEVYHLAQSTLAPMTAANQTLIYSLTAAQGAAAQPSIGNWPFTAATGLYPILQVHMDATDSGTPNNNSLPFLAMEVDYVRIWSPAGADPNQTGSTVITTSGSVAMKKTKTNGTISTVTSGVVNCSGAVAMKKAAVSGTVNGGTGGGGGGSVISLTDAFGTNDTGTTWANSYGTFNVDNGRASIQSDTSYSSGLVSTSVYNLTGSSVSGQFEPFINAGSEFTMQVYTDANDLFTFGYFGGQIQGQLTQSGTTTSGPFVTYSLINHAWWRIREQTGTVYFDTSVDGNTWTNYWSSVYSINVTAVAVYMVAGNFNTGGPTGTCYVTNVNVSPAAAATFVDPFDTNDLSTNWSWSYGTFSVANSECSIQADTSYSSGIVTSVTYNLQSSYFAVEMLPYIATSGNTALQIFDGYGNYAEIAYQGGVMAGNLNQNGTLTTGPTVTYSATNHAWWRVRESSGKVYMETSPDANTWTTIWSTAYTFSITGVTAQVYAGDYGSDPTGTSFVTNVNVPGVTCSGSVAMKKWSVNGSTGAATTTSGSVAMKKMSVAGTVSITAPLVPIGTPTMTRSTSGTVTPVFGTGQSDNAGDLLVCIVSAAAATSVTTLSTPSGWTKIVEEGNSATAHTRVAAYYMVAAGSDVLPAFTSTLTGTGAMTATVYEVPSWDTNGPIDGYGVYASGSSTGSLTAMSAPASQTTVGSMAIGAFVQERAAATNTWNESGSGFVNSVNDGATSSVAHTAINVNSATGGSLATELQVTDAGHWTTNTTAFGSGIVVVFLGAQGGSIATSVLTDAFSTNDLATLWGDSFGTVTVSGGQCHIQCDPSYDSALASTNRYDIRGSYVYAQFFPYTAANAETGLQLYLDASNNAAIVMAENAMVGTITQAGVKTTLFTVTYNATTHAWWQLTESSGTLFYQTSPDGATWSTLGSSTYSFEAAQFTVGVFAGDDAADATGTSSLDSFNTQGSTTSSGSVAMKKMSVSGQMSVATTGNITTSGSVAMKKMSVSGTGSNFNGNGTSGSVAMKKMSLGGTATVVNPPLFPQNAVLNILVEILLNGVWTNITSYVYQNNGITITRGRADETSIIQPGTLALNLNNRDGRFSPRNPAGAYYPYLTRNTQIRVSAPVDALQDSLAYRFWGEVTAWPPTWDVTGQDVEVPIQGSGIMRRLSQSGSASLQSALSRYYLNQPAGSQVVGYWPCEDATGATSLASPVTGVLPMTLAGSPQLASTTIAAGSNPVPTLNNSAWTGTIASAAIGSRTSTKTITTTGAGQFTAQAAQTTVQMWGAGGGGAGAAGSGGAGAEYAQETLATSSGFVCNYSIGTGGSGGSGTPGGVGATGGNTTFTGTQKTITAHGGQGAANGNGTTGGTGSNAAIHYDGGDAHPSQEALGDGGGGGASSAGVNSAGADGGAHAGAGGGAAGVAPSGGGNGGTGGNNTGHTGNPGAPGSQPGGGGGAGAWSSTFGAGGKGGNGKIILSWVGSTYASVDADVLRFLMEVPADGDFDGATVARMYTNGTVSYMDLILNITPTPALRLIAYNTTSGGTNPTVLYDSGVQAVNLDMMPYLVSMEIQQNGTSGTFVLGLVQPGPQAAETIFSGTVANITVSTVSSVVINPNRQLANTAIGQVSVQYTSTNIVDVAFAASGYAGEDAVTRFNRLCGENSIPVEITGNASDASLMGAQTAEPLISLLQECEDVDRGQIYEPRDMFGLGYRTRVDMSNQTPDCTLDYISAQLASPLLPTDDDLLIGNDIIVTRTGGSSYELSATTGAMNIQEPPLGIGDYQKNYTINVQNDGQQLQDTTGWLLSLGTVDQQRFPEINVDLARSEMIGVFSSVQAMDVGDYLEILNPPAWMPPEPMRQLTLGWTETLNAYQWTITWNCVPALPYFTGVLEDAVYSELDTDGSVLYANIGTGDTTILVQNVDTPWTLSNTDTPFQILMDGEIMTVTDVANSGTTQTLTVVRSVNGISKSHNAGETISLAYPTILGM